MGRYLGLWVENIFFCSQDLILFLKLLSDVAYTSDTIFKLLVDLPSYKIVGFLG